MYDIYLKLLREKGVRTSDVCRATGIVASTFSDWKKGKSTPKAEKLQKIADYFGVTVDYLMTGNDNKNLTPRDEFLNKLTLRAEKAFAEYGIPFDGSPESEEMLSSVLEYMDFLVANHAKKKNKTDTDE